MPHPKKKYSILGQKAVMKCGLEAEVIEDFGWNDITVRFNDGYTTYHRERNAFRNGKISHPNCKIKSTKGQKALMNNGMYATVIQDYNSKNITVKFDDGTIVSNVRRESFFKGRISNPNVVPNSIKGTISMMNCGMLAEVVEDLGDEDITVKFADGTIRKHCTRHNFSNGKIGNPSIANNYSLPQTLVYFFIHKFFPDAISNYRPSWLRNSVTSANLELDIWLPSRRVGIEYDGYRFHNEETQKTITKAKLIAESNEITKIITILERGAIPHFSDKHTNYQLDYISEYNEYALLFQQLTDVINDILSNLGIDEKIAINDDTIHGLYYNMDMLSYRKITVDNVDGIKQNTRKASSVLGQSTIMKCGLSATVIEDNGYNDIIVQFEDGFTVKSNRYSFRKKTIKNPNRSVFSIVGQTNIMNNGMKAEVIEDNGAYDIKVKFSDGYVTSCCRSAFRKGLILNPNVKKGSLLGKSELMHCGMKCKVIEDNGCNDILVEFEDGYIKKSRRQSYKSREISNPQINRHSIKGTTLRMECGMCCTVIEDISSQDITVQFEDGYIAYHRERSAFTKRKISNPNIKSTNI